MLFPLFYMVSGSGPPVLTSLNFTLGDTAGGGQNIVATGTSLSGATVVTIDGVNHTPISSTPTSCTFALPAHAVGVVNITVTTPAGTSNALTFRYWDLTQITGIYACYDANKNVTEVAGSVSAWNDLSGNAHHLTATSNPTLVANQFGTLPSIRFAGPQSLTIGGGGLAAVSTWSYFALAKWTSTTTTGSNLTYGVPLTIFGGGGWSGFGASGDQIAYKKYDVAQITGDVGLNDGNPHLIGVTGDATPTIKLYRGSALKATATPGGTNLNYEDHVGTGYVGTDGFVGDIGALVIVNGVIPGGDLTYLDQWAQQRFNAA